MKNKKNIIMSSIFAVALISAVYVGATQLSQNGQRSNSMKAESQQVTFAEATKAVVYKSPTCGCCSGHAEAMELAGIEVEIIEMPDVELAFFKEDQGIPMRAASCHTSLITQGEHEYIVEGHVPIAGIKELFDQRPDIDGVVLPGMPIGTPGMPGTKLAPYKVMMIDNGEVGELFLSL